MQKTIMWLSLVALAGGNTVALDRFVAPGGSHTPPFTNWAMAATNLNAAVDAANTNNTGDTVWVSNGTYVLTATVFVTNTIVRGFGANNTGVVVSGNGSLRCFYLNHTNALVQDLTISNGFAGAAPLASYGGGACVVTGSLRHCVLANNKAYDIAQGHGGGAYSGSAGVLISNCVFVTNYSGSAENHQSAGGLYMDGGVATGCLFSNNVSIYKGGGAHLYGGGLITNCTFSGNNARYGGGVCVQTGTVANCLMFSNTTRANDGGGAYLTGTNALLMNCTSSWNSAAANGGGVAINYGLVTNCVINNNYAQNGGGVYMANTSTLANCIIAGNSNLDGAVGGGINCSTLNGLVINCQITSNRGGIYGGGFSYGSAARGAIVRNCSISSNIIYASSVGWGIGVFAQSGSSGLLLDGCKIADNMGWVNGGGIMFYQSAGTARNCRITGNTVINKFGGQYGGGAAFAYGGGTLVNCLIANNVVTNGAIGGGVAFSAGRENLGIGTLINCTVVSNNAADTGHGGGLVFGTGAGVATGLVVNCIVCSNLSSTAVDYNWYKYDATSSLIASNSCTFPTNGILGSGNTSTDPKFASASAGDYHLLKWSPCINTGTNQAWMTTATDLDGHARLDIIAFIVDMGAYEYYALPGTLITVR